MALMVLCCIYIRESPLAVSQELSAVLLLFPCFSPFCLLVSPDSSIESCRMSFSDSVSKRTWFMREK